MYFLLFSIINFSYIYFTDLDKDDIWHKLSPPAESRMFFVLCEGTPSSPPLQVEQIYMFIYS